MINKFKFNDSTAIDIPSGLTIFCDMDGTLVDTDYANFLSYRRALIEVTCGAHDVDFTGDRLDREVLKKRFPSLTSKLDVIVALKAKYFMEFVAETRLNTALAHLISQCCGKNTIVLVTCCREKRAVVVLEHHKLLKCFARLICWEDLSQGGSSNKYESAIKLMEVSQEAVVIFENDKSCIEEAVLAGGAKKKIYMGFFLSSGGS